MYWQCMELSQDVFVRVSRALICGQAISTYFGRYGNAGCWKLEEHEGYFYFGIVTVYLGKNFRAFSTVQRDATAYSTFFMVWHLWSRVNGMWEKCAAVSEACLRRNFLTLCKASPIYFSLERPTIVSERMSCKPIKVFYFQFRSHDVRKISWNQSKIEDDWLWIFPNSNVVKLVKCFSLPSCLWMRIFQL